MSNHVISEVYPQAGASQPGHFISGIDREPVSDTTLRAYPVEFIGSGSEYFRIWIINLLFSICTLGIYSAWAKVRSQRYLHFNTRIDGASFGYHARPLPILIGRLVALLLFLAYFVLTRAMPLFGLLIVMVLALMVAPWLLHRALRFRLTNLSYRGLRFGFRGPLWKSYLVFGLYSVLTVLTAYLLTPFTHRAIKAYQHNNSTYGDTRFSFQGKTGDFYVEYLLWLLKVLVLAGGPILGVWLYLGGAEGAVAGPDEACLLYTSDARVLEGATCVAQSVWEESCVTAGTPPEGAPRSAEVSTAREKFTIRPLVESTTSCAQKALLPC